jgi:hypothetical protein
MVIFVGFSGAKAITLNRTAFTLTDPATKGVVTVPFEIEWK